MGVSVVSGVSDCVDVCASDRLAVLSLLADAGIVGDCDCDTCACSSDACDARLLRNTALRFLLCRTQAPRPRRPRRRFRVDGFCRRVRLVRVVVVARVTKTTSVAMVANMT
mgnify:CR=1 FL=1